MMGLYKLQVGVVHLCYWWHGISTPLILLLGDRCARVVEWSAILLPRLVLIILVNVSKKMYKRSDSSQEFFFHLGSYEQHI